MYYFILLSIHIGVAAIVTGTAIGAHYNWTRRWWVSSIVGGLHCAVWCIAWVGLTYETFGGTL
jgi:hypothetical protein